MGEAHQPPNLSGNMIADDPIMLLADSLRRVRSGEERTQDVIRWLRAWGPAAAEIPKPVSKPVHRNYTRTLLHKADDFEILVLHWAPNSISAIHDHGGAFCWLTVSRGAMTVENYLRLDEGEQPGYAAIASEGKEQLESGDVDHRQDDRHLHKCISRDCETVTLHVYARPIEKFRGFDESTRRCFEITSAYDAVLAAL